MKYKTIIIISVIVLLLAGSVWFYANAQKKKTEDPGNIGDGSGSPVVQSVKFPLQQGSRGKAVEAIQSALNSKFNAGLTMDGIWGAKTQKALLANKMPTVINAAEFTQITGTTPESLSVDSFTSGKINPLNPLTWF